MKITKLLLSFLCFHFVTLFLCHEQQNNHHFQSMVMAYDWTKVDEVINKAIQDKYFPGAAALVADETGVIYAKGYGHFTYDTSSPAVNIHTMYDMASLTKVLTVTTAIGQFYQRGDIGLHDKVSSIFPQFSQEGKGDIEILHLMLHNSGFPPDPYPGYYSKQVGCPESFQYYPKLSFSCQSIIFNDLMSQKLQNPIGQKYVYSDLSMITLMYVIGHLAETKGYIKSSDLLPNCVNEKKDNGYQQCYFEAYIRKYVLDRLSMNDSGFLPPKEKYFRCAPTVNDTSFRHQMLQGIVHDGNAFSLGGVSGHAGFFSTAVDVDKLLRAIMFQKGDVGLNETTVKYFTHVYNATQSTRALGWDTNNDGTSTCGTLSKTTYLHTGYTGTQCCSDPDRRLFTVLLTNRVYPDDKTSIQDIRRSFNSAVQIAYDESKN